MSPPLPLLLLLSLTISPKGDLFSGVEGTKLPYASLGNSVPAGWREATPAMHPLDPVRPQGDSPLAVCWRAPEMPADPRVPPSGAECVESLRLSVARGEYEANTLLFYAFRDLPELDARVEGLDLPAECRFSTWLWTCADEMQMAYHPYEAALVHGPQDLPAGRTTRLWCTVWCSPGTRAGAHGGTLVLTSRGEEIARLALTVEVLPIDLPDPPLDYAFWYGPVWAWKQTYAANMPRHFAQMREYGLTSVVMANITPGLSVRPDGTVAVDWINDDRVVDAFMGAGLHGPVVVDARGINGWCSAYGEALAQAGGDPAKLGVIKGAYQHKPYDSPATRNAFLQVMTELVTHARERGWPEVWAYAQEESYNEADRIEQLRYFVPLLRELKIKTYLVSNAPWWRPDETVELGDLWDVRCYSFFNETLVSSARAAGRELAGFNLSWLGPRRAWGVWALRAGLSHVSQWCYQFGDPIESGKRAGLYSPSSGCAYPTPSGPLPTRELVLLREGIDDARYIYAVPEPQRAVLLRLLSERLPLDGREMGLGYLPHNNEAELRAVRLVAANLVMGKDAALVGWLAPTLREGWTNATEMLVNGGFEQSSRDRWPQGWQPQLPDLPPDAIRVSPEAALEGTAGARFTRTSPQDSSAPTYLLQQLDAARCSSAHMTLAGHLRVVEGEGEIYLRLRCRRHQEWLKDAARVWIIARANELLIVEQVNGRSWGYRRLATPTGGWVEVRSEGLVAASADFVEAFVGITPARGRSLTVDLDAIEARASHTPAPGAWPAYNLVTPLDPCLPVLVTTRGRADVLLDGRPVILAAEDAGQAAIHLGVLRPGNHKLALDEGNLNAAPEQVLFRVLEK